MLIHGKCHCGAIVFALDWPGDQPNVIARACSCSFCSKHGGVWTANPDAKVSVTLKQIDIVSRYSFGTNTAAFYVCKRCGAVPFATSEIESHVYAVVNANTFEDLDSSRLIRQSVSFEGEEQRSRLARRQRNWISRVEISMAVPNNLASSAGS